MKNFAIILGVVILFGISFALGGWVSKNDVKQEKKITSDTVNNNIPVMDPRQLVDAEVIENISDRVNLYDKNLDFFDGQLKYFVIAPAYYFVLEKVTEIEQGVTETQWSFLVGGDSKKFKTLSAKCTLKRDLSGELIKRGQINISEKEAGTSTFAGLLQPLGKNLFTGDDETACSKVWGGLKIYSQLKEELVDFFSLGEKASEWKVGEDGIVDLTDKITLTLAGKYEE